MKTKLALLLGTGLLTLALPGPARADQTLPGNVTISGGTASGNLTVTGNGNVSGTLNVSGALNVTGIIDSTANTLAFGTQGAGIGASLVYADANADTLTFFINRSPGSWRWLHGGVTAMRLDATHKLSLYQADGTTVGAGLDPVSNTLSLGSATLFRDATGALATSGAFNVTGALNVSGAFTAPNYTATGGTISGGATGLTLNAGGTNQNLTLAPSGIGFVTTNARVVINNATASTSPTTGALVIGSNVGLSGNAGGSTYFAGPLYSTNSTGGVMALFGTNATAAPYLILASGVGGASQQAWGIDANITGTDGNLTFYDNTAGVSQMVVHKGGVGASYVSIAGNMDASTAGTGSFTTPGGIYAAKKIIGSEHDLTGGATITGAAGALNLTAAGTNQNILLTPSGTGNVGIGTPTPSATLDVYGTVLIDGPSGSLSFQGRNGYVTTVPGAANPFIYSSARYPGDGSGTFPFNNYGEMIFQGNLRAGYNGGFTFVTGQDSVIGNTITPSVALRITEAGKVGIGTATPNASLDIWKAYSAGTDSLRFSYNDGSAYWMGIQPYVVGAGNVGYKFRTTNATNTVDALAITGAGNVGIGTTNPTKTLTVNGTILAKEVIVQSGWADYVFDQNYRLAPLREVEARIKAEHHLPGIPSAQEVAEHGASMGEMQAKLLSKVEELTLHLIEQEKRIEKLEAENAALRSR